MQIQHLQLQNFRNYDRAELEFDPRMNLIHGSNAQGKSNLLEAICYLGVASSFRAAGELELIRHDQPYFFLSALARGQAQGRLEIAAAMNRRQQRRWTVNNQHLTRLADMIGVLHIVVFAPEDVALVKGGPEPRRRYLNRQLSQLDRVYCRQVIQYNQVLRQRNACLKLWEQQRDPEQLAAWSQQLVTLGAAISLARERLTEKLRPRLQQLHCQLAPGEELDLRYQPSPRREAASGSDGGEEELRQLFRQELARLERAELARGLTLAGPHRDEVALTINGRSARDFASQGQQRTAALSLRLAELELARDQRGEYPLLLMDDVFSELDPSRRQQLIALTAGKAQTFITAVDPDLPLSAGRRFLIREGTAEIRG